VDGHTLVTLLNVPLSTFSSERSILVIYGLAVSCEPDALNFWSQISGVFDHRRQPLRCSQG
jgi:hypothetical protein